MHIHRSQASSFVSLVILLTGLALAFDSHADPGPQLTGSVGRVLNTAIEALDAQRFDEATAAIETLERARLSPFELARVEQILFNVAYARGNLAEGRRHLELAIGTGALSAQEVSQARYQLAQLLMAEQRWSEGAAALADWFSTESNPNAAAYYLLAVAFYQMDDFEHALAPAEQAVARMTSPREEWLQLLLALHLQRDDFGNAVPLLQRLVALDPAKKAYWLQLSAAYGRSQDYASALATLQLAYDSGLLSERDEFLRLADLMIFNGLPSRAARMLEEAMETDAIRDTAEVYQKLAESWIAAGEQERALAPLLRAAELVPTGPRLIRVGELGIELADWVGAERALRAALEHDLTEPAKARFLLGVSLFEQDRLAEARHWFESVAEDKQYQQSARTYLHLIGRRIGAERVL